jgi:hypothetical protein
MTPKLDVDPGDTGDTGGEGCKVDPDGMDAAPPCEEKAPPDSFEPEAQWSWKGPDGFEQSVVTPLVINLTDDNSDGEIDLCDTPDVVVVAGPGQTDIPPSRLYVLDGATGEEHFFAEELVQWGATPAVGDIDGDGIPELVSVEPGLEGRLLAFEHDGSLKWKSDEIWPQSRSSAIALADIDNDGDVEIIAGRSLYDHEGKLTWAKPNDRIYSASAAHDIDDDGELEVLVGHAAYDPDGTEVWARAEIEASIGTGLHPQVADMDDDGLPEVLVTSHEGIYMLEHDGTPIWSQKRPTGEPDDWNRPINIHDFTGDGVPGFGLSAKQHYAIHDPQANVVWSADVSDISGQSGGTAFDFLGAGLAQAIYSDENNVWVFDDLGSTLMMTDRRSITIIEYPVVADVDDDGSAEILVVSNAGFDNIPNDWTVQAVRDVDDRWVPARRIWNQHTYHVTNVLEDGRIPQNEKPHWELLNTYRTQAQVMAGGGVCQPEPEG